MLDELAYLSIEELGFNWEGLYTTSLLDAHANWRARANQLSRTLKISVSVWNVARV